MKEEKTTSSANSLGNQPAPNLANNPEVKDRGLAESNQQEEAREDMCDLRRGVFRTEDTGLFLRSS